MYRRRLFNYLVSILRSSGGGAAPSDEIWTEDDFAITTEIDQELLTEG